VDYARSLNQVEVCDVYILEYPGYGPRPGMPSQQSLFDAAAEAMALLEKKGSVYLVGESLGTGVAAYLAGTHSNSVAGVLLIAPYHNLGDVAQNHMPIFPARLMILDRFPSASYLQTFHGPVAVLLAGRDTVVPNKFGRKLFDAYSGPKKVWEIPLATHNDLPNVPVDWWKELIAFWKSAPSSRTGI
jgi:pimeloyl-ACP methyl ester carboxylesterase